MKTRKILSILLVIAMLMGLLCIGASATNYATGIAVYVYKSANDYTVYELGTLTDGPSALDAFEQADSTSAATYTTATNGSWLYTINGNLASYSASDYTVQNNDFLAFYLVPDYTEDTLITPSYYTEWVINGVLQSVTTTHLLGNDIGMEIGLNYAHPTVNYGSASSTYQAKSANSPLTNIDGFLFISGSATDHNVLKTCYPVKLRSMDSTWMNVMRGQAAQLKVITDDISATEIGTNAKTDLDSKAADAVGAYPYPPVLMGKLIDFEDAFAALTYTVDARLDFVSFTEDLAVTSPFFPYHTAYTVQSSTADPTAVPTSFSMTVTPKDSTASVSVSSDDTGVSISGTGNTRSITLPANATSTITVTITKGTVSKEYTFTLTTPDTSSTSDYPDTVCGYLPIGQFARPNSYGWGTIYTDGTNVYASTKTPKFTAGYVSTGVSLGMLGGYVQYEFDTAISNDPTNPYGIDFIVYGNAFNGNPEAGAVMVYGKNTATDSYGWYNLAGSRHYISGTVKSENITYIKIVIPENQTSITIGGKTFTASGIYYSKNFVKPTSDTQSLVNAAIGAATWTSISTNTGWWPEQGDSENYDEVWKMHRPDTTTVGQTGIDSHVGGVYWYTSGTAEVIRYEGVTEVADSDSTDAYQWGYADVRQNGSNYGVAINPYASAASAVSGGDGFDLSWAVDAEGKPVNLTDVRFVRVYSAVLYNAGVFGETSAEVCGIYVASGTGSSTITAPTYISVSSTSGATSNRSFANGGTQNIRLTGATTAYIKVTSGSSYIFINGELVSSGNEKSVPLTSEYTIVQVITQNGTESPYITAYRIRNT